jgi:hypothetical protein
VGVLLILAAWEEVVLDGDVDLGHVETGKVPDALYHVVAHGLETISGSNVRRTPISLGLWVPASLAAYSLAGLH